MPIPKIIHQIWFQGENKIPPHFLEYQKTWKEKHSNYRYIFWDEKSINKLIQYINIDWITETYHGFPLMIQKIDFAKYLFLYYIGGIYIDMDIECLKSLDNILELPNMKNKKFIGTKIIFCIMQSVFFLLSGNLNMGTIVNNGVIMCESKHKLMWNVIEGVCINKNNIFKNKSNFLYIFYSTGPLMMSDVIIDYMHGYNKLNDIMLLDSEYFEPLHLHEVKNNTYKKIPSKSIGIHRFNQSWVNNDENTLLKYVLLIRNNNYAIILFIIGLLLVIHYVMRFTKKIKC